MSKIMQPIFKVLLSKTIRHAKKFVPAYQESLPDVGGEVDVDQLAQLPILRKSDILSDPERFRSSSVEATFVQHTSGTSGQALLIERADEEVKFRQKHTTALQTKTKDNSVIHISLGPDFGHGTPMRIHSNQPTFTLSLDDWLWDVRLEDIITNPWLYACCPKLSAVVSGSESSLRKLTGKLVERGFDFANSAIVGLLSTGDAVTSHRIQWYEKVWRAKYYNRYSMSETQAAADVCNACGRFHFEPPVIAEFVDPFSKKVISSGIGVIVVTTLYPFIQRQPLIRYWTGDLVKLHICPTDKTGFELLGRETDCVVKNSKAGPRLLISSIRTQEVMDKTPECAMSGDWKTGFPMFQIDSYKGKRLKIVLTFQSNYCNILHQEHDRMVCLNIRDTMLRLHPKLSEDVELKKIKFSVCSTNKLESFLRPGQI